MPWVAASDASGDWTEYNEEYVLADYVDETQSLYVISGSDAAAWTEASAATGTWS